MAESGRKWQNCQKVAERAKSGRRCQKLTESGRMWQKVAERGRK